MTDKLQGPVAPSPRAAILAALDRWTRQRPGLDPRNYGGSWSAYREDARGITRQLADFRVLLRAVAWREASVDAAALLGAFGPGLGCLSVRVEEVGGGYRAVLEYAIVQHWPTEYRAAACAVLARALRRVTRETWPNLTDKELRATMRREVGRGVATRWLS